MNRILRVPRERVICRCKSLPKLKPDALSLKLIIATYYDGP